MKDGIYFDLPDHEYHAINRLSASGICNMLVSPATFWARSWMNPTRDNGDTLARTLGRAYHTARLEPELFEHQFVRDLVKEDMPEGTLMTDAEIKAALKDLGEPQTKAGETVLDRARRLEEISLNVIWHIERAEFEEELDGRTPLAPRYYDQLIEDIAQIHAVPEVMRLLTGGAAEVSILWTCPKTGIEMKGRIDYLHPRGFTDFKTFDNARGKPVDQAIRDAFQWNRYYIQAALYWSAVEMIRGGLLAIEGKCSDAQVDLVAALQKRPEPAECWYVFQEKGDAPNVLAREIVLSVVHDSAMAGEIGATSEQAARARAAVTQKTVLLRKAEIEIEHAQAEFRRYMEVFGEGEAWHPINPVGKISDEDFSPFWLDQMPEGA